MGVSLTSLQSNITVGVVFGGQVIFNLPLVVVPPIKLVPEQFEVLHSNIATGLVFGGQVNRASLVEIAAIVSETMDVPAPLLVCPMPLARISLPLIDSFTRLSGRQPLYTSVSLKTLCENQIVSHQHATDDLNYQPRPLRETLEDTLSWFKENGYLSCSPGKVPERTP